MGSQELGFRKILKTELLTTSAWLTVLGFLGVQTMAVRSAVPRCCQEVGAAGWVPLQDV